jgi:hypothetical protein
MPTMSARIASILLLGALAALLAGCGGDKRRAEAETGTTQPGVSAPKQPSPSGTVRVTRVTDPVRRAYVGRVDAICRQVDPERTSRQEQVSASSSTADAVRAYDDTIALGWRELRRIEAIRPPPGDAALLKANVFAAVRAQLALRAQMGKALAAADVPALHRLRSELDNSTRALTGFARGYGFRVCGEA